MRIGNKFTITSALFAALLGLHLVFPRSAFAAEDLLAINETIWFQLVIFVSAIFILNALIFKPLIALLAKRLELTAGTVHEAEELQIKAKTMVEEFNAKLNEARASVMGDRDRIRRETQAQAAEKIGKAREAAQVVIEDSRARLARETAAMKEEIKPEIEVIAREITYRILGREVQL